MHPNIVQIRALLEQRLSPEVGSVHSSQYVEGGRFVMVVENTPWNYGVQRSIVQILTPFLRQWTFDLVGQDGAWGYIDTSSLREVSDKARRQTVADRFLRDMHLGAAEYCSCTNPDRPFPLVGLEDKQLLDQARKLWASREDWSYAGAGGMWVSPAAGKFNRLEASRAEAMSVNLMAAMSTHSRQSFGAAAVICCGHLPELLCQNLTWRAVSWARITPAGSGPDEPDLFMARHRGVHSPLEEILSELPEFRAWPESGTTWRQYRDDSDAATEMKIGNGEPVAKIVPEIKEMLTSRVFRKQSIEDRRKVLAELDLPISVLAEILPAAELDELYRFEERRFLRMEELLSHAQFLELPDIGKKLSNLAERIPDADLVRLLGSGKVAPDVKVALRAQLLKGKIRTYALEEVLQSNPLDRRDADAGADGKGAQAGSDTGEAGIYKALGEAALQRFEELKVFGFGGTFPESAVRLLWEQTADYNECDTVECLNELIGHRLVLSQGAQADRSLRWRDERPDAGGTAAPAVHSALVSAYAAACNGRWHESPDDGYFFDHIVRHLVKAGRAEEAGLLLLEFDWVRTKLGVRDVRRLLQDYEVVLRAAAGESPPEWVLAAGDVKGALWLSADALIADRHQLNAQLLGRLQHHQTLAVRKLLTQAAQPQSAAWLRPASSSLTRPGGYLVSFLRGHSKRVTSVVAVPGQPYILSASEDGTVQLWDPMGGGAVRTFRGHASEVNDVAISPDGKVVVSAGGTDAPGSDHSLRLWELETGREIGVLPGQGSRSNGVAFAGNGRLVVSGGGTYSPVEKPDAAVRVWDAVTRELLFTLPGHTGNIRAVAAAPQSRFAVTGSGGVYFPDPSDPAWSEALEDARLLGLKIPGGGTKQRTRDDSLRIWDLTAGREAHVLQGHEAPVTDLTITPDGRFALSASQDSTIRAWELETGEEIKQFRGHDGTVRALALTPDGRVAVSTAEDEALIVWDIREDNLRRPGCGVPFASVPGIIRGAEAMTVTSDGRYVVSGHGNGSLMIWDLASLVRPRPDSSQPVWAEDRHTSLVDQLAVSRDGARVATSSCDESIMVWSAEDGRLLHRIGCHNTASSPLATLPHGAEIFASSHIGAGIDLRHACAPIAMSGQSDLMLYGERTLTLFDLGRMASLGELEGHTAPVLAVAFLPGGDGAVSASKDGTLRLWDIASRRTTRVLEGHTGFVKALGVSSDGTLIASGGADRAVRVWETRSGRCIRCLRGLGNVVQAVGLLPAADWVAAVAGNADVRVWNWRSGALQYGANLLDEESAGKPGSRPRFAGAKAPGLLDRLRARFTSAEPPHQARGLVSAARLIPDSQFLLAQCLPLAESPTWEIGVWDLRTGRKTLALAGAEGSIGDVVWAERLGYVAAGDGRTLRLWNARTGAPLADFRCDSDIAAIVEVPTHGMLVVGETAGRVHFLKVESPSEA